MIESMFSGISESRRLLAIGHVGLGHNHQAAGRLEHQGVVGFLVHDPNDSPPVVRLGSRWFDTHGATTAARVEQVFRASNQCWRVAGP